MRGSSEFMTSPSLHARLPWRMSLKNPAATCSTNAKARISQFMTMRNDWWPGTELNRRHADFQSAALPTELPGHSLENWSLKSMRDHSNRTFTLSNSALFLSHIQKIEQSPPDERQYADDTYRQE
jgi:hypothetical protein